MKSFFRGVWLGLKSLVTRPIEYMTNPIGTTTSVYREELIEEGKTDEEVREEIKAYEDSGGLVFALHSGLSKLAKGISGGLSFVLKNLPQIVLVAALIFVAWYVLKLVKIVKVAT